jgi:KAP family P-loop domain
MLATVISDPATPMPLSVGIFGEWGSGKSYFMGLMREEIERLSGSGLKAYLKNVVQIGFNAWHYADTNLWASLGDEIFRQLAGPGETAPEGRRRLREELVSGAAEREALEARAAQARAETVRLKAALYEAMSARQLRAKDLLNAIKNSAQLRKQLDRVWRQLGIDTETQQAQTLADQLSGADSAAGPLSGVLARQRTWTLIAICLTAVLGVLAAVWAPAAWGRWLGGSGVAAVVVTISVVTAWIGRARSGLAQLRYIAADINKNAVISADQRTAEAVKDAVHELRQAEALEAVAQARLDEMSERVTQLARDLADLLPGQRLYSFLAERATGGQYASQLGLISTIRKDFEHLVELLRDWRVAGSDEAAPRPIDRIVLYIDDLDRCRPQQVVDVLQAVHLLLALDLFVVVVGVDPRWLRRSLQHQYEGILGVGEVREPADQPLWQITPNDYLEKIFNIPFVLPGIPEGSFERMLRGLSGPVSDRAEYAQEDHQMNDPAVPVTPRQQLHVEPGATVTIERHSELAASFVGDSDELPRPLTEPELAFLGALQVYIGTPREAKRMVTIRKSCDPVRVYPGRRGPARSQPHDFRIPTKDVQPLPHDQVHP